MLIGTVRGPDTLTLASRGYETFVGPRYLFPGLMKFVVCLWCTAPAAALTITSNDFEAFSTAVSSAAPGSTIDFDLGASSTIQFTHPVSLQSDITIHGNNTVIFDGGDATGMFSLGSGVTANFSGLRFQHGLYPAIYSSYGLANVANCSFFYNNGGAILGNVQITGSTFAFNQARFGGAVCADGIHGKVIVDNSTFFGNSAYIGGAIDGNTRTLVLRNSTVFGNVASLGGGVAWEGRGGYCLIESSILAGNVKTYFSTESHDLYIVPGSILIDHSLVGTGLLIGLHDGVNNGVYANVVGDGVHVAGVAIDDLLGDLRDNGGPTMTMALLGSNNPALGAGSNPLGVAYDQRGAPYSRVNGLGVDIGAFELQVPEPATCLLALIGFTAVTLTGWRKR